MTIRALSIIAGAVMAVSMPSQAAVPGKIEHRQTLSAATKKSVPERRRAPPSQIACTIYGCHPIPPGCHPEMGYNWDGIPTGFDIVVCGPRRAYPR